MMVPRDRHYYIYLKALEKAVADKYLSLDESNMLDHIVEHFGFDQEVVDAAVDHVDGRVTIEWTSDEIVAFETGTDAKSDRELYAKILSEALGDDRITDDEWAILNNLRNLFGLDDDEHIEIENDVREHLEKGGDTKLLDRLSGYVRRWIGRGD